MRIRAHLSNRSLSLQQFHSQDRPFSSLRALGRSQDSIARNSKVSSPTVSFFFRCPAQTGEATGSCTMFHHACVDSHFSSQRRLLFRNGSRLNDKRLSSASKAYTLATFHLRAGAVPRKNASRSGSIQNVGPAGSTQTSETSSQHALQR